MVKQHMSSIDVAAQVACLQQKLLGLRVANIYDLNPKTYILKLSKSGEDGDKVFLTLESGVRFHTSPVLRDKSDIPSNFSLKLRKHIRTKRLEAVRQLGVDRIVDFTFGSGEATVHLILELYAQGNIVLADSKYEVLTLLRSHRDDDKNFAVLARHPYPMSHVRLRSRVTSQHVLQAAATAQPGTNLKGLLAGVLGYGPAIAEHVVRDAGLDPLMTVVASSSNAAGGAAETGTASSWQLPDSELQALEVALQQLDQWLASLDTTAPQGIITCVPPGGKKQAGKQGKAHPAQTAGAGEAAPDGHEEQVIYNEFHPLLMHQHEGMKTLHFATFDEALDDFFGKIEGQRSEVARAEAERSALSKLDKIKTDQMARAAALAKEAEESELRGQLITYNLDAVDAVITALNESLATGMDWHDLERLIKDERKAGNPVAQYIHSLQLDANRATLLLSNHLDDEDEGDEAANARKATKVVIDLGLSAHANAAMHYDARKKHIVKQAKTLAANEAALKAAEKKAAVTLTKVRAVPSTAIARKPHWFERFHWFISSENYLVISGRDAQQNELIVKRYFRRGDVYVHADLHGASSTIVKNPNPDMPIPPLTLQQAGCACVCRSRAWDSKIVTSAWWVHHHQVSKTAPTGEYLPTGSFMIRGKKSFLPPQPLVFGFGFMFKLDPDCIAAHVGERAVRTGADTDMLSMALTNMDMDVDVSEMDLGVPDIDEQDEGSALDRFMSGTYTAAASSGGPSQLSRAAVAAVGGTTTTADVAQQYERYGLAIEEGEEGEGESEAGRLQGKQMGGAADHAAGKRHLSVKEKELLKKGKQLPGGGVAQGGGGVGKAQQAQKGGAGAQGKPATVQKDMGNVRGKKAKQQRVKDKYADQDEDERQLALAILGAAGEKKTRADRRKERKERKEATRQQARGADTTDMAEAIAAATRKQFSSSQDEDSSGSADEEADQQEGQSQQQALQVKQLPVEQQASDQQTLGLEAQSAANLQPVNEANGHTDARRTGEQQQQQQDAAEDGQEEENVEEEEEEEQGDQLGDEEKEKLNVLDSLTGCPRPEDVLLYAVPVCGPYSMLQNWKFKVKLTPGTVKKGRAARQAQELLSRGPDVSQRERDLIKAVPDMDMINAIVGTVKLSMPGLAKLKAGEKQAKKAAAKERTSKAQS